MQTNLIIDTFNLTARLRHVYWPDGLILDKDDYRLIKHFLISLTHLMVEFAPVRIILACDSKSYFRSQYFEPYKSQRSRCEVYDTHKRACFKMAKNCLPVTGLQVKGYEADDIMARLVEQNTKDAFCIVSTDRDLFQIQCAYPDRVKIYNPTKKQNVQFEHGDVDFLQYKALTADVGDNIPSATGEKTALKLLRGEMDMDSWLDAGLTRSEKKPRREVYQRNLKLVSLFGENALLEAPPLPSISECSAKGDYALLREMLSTIGLNRWVNSEEFDKMIDKWENWESMTFARLNSVRRKIERSGQPQA